MKIKSKSLFALLAAGIVMVGLCIMLINPANIFAAYTYSYTEVENGIAITKVPETTGNSLRVPAEIDGKAVVKIESGAFTTAPHITELIIPQTVKTIDFGAFSGLKYLETLTIPFVGASADATGMEKTLGYMFGDITGTGAYTLQVYSETESKGFYLPYQLKTVTVQGGTLGYGSFSNCTTLETVTVESSEVTEIPPYAFKSTTAIQTVVLPSETVKIGDKAFYRSSVMTINLDNISQIGDEAFVEAQIFSLDISSAVTIGNKAFYGLNKLTNITFSEELQSIGEYAFAHCSLLKDVEIPANVSNIGKGVFYQNNRLETITYTGENFVSEEQVLYNADKTRLIVYPAGKTGSSFTVPEGVTLIEEGAFNGNKFLKSITVSSTTQTIGYGAFSACPSLSTLSVYFNGASADATGEQALQGYVLGETAFEGSVTQTEMVDGKTYYYCWPNDLVITLMEK